MVGAQIFSANRASEHMLEHCHLAIGGAGCRTMRNTLGDVTLDLCSRDGAESARKGGLQMLLDDPFQRSWVRGLKRFATRSHQTLAKSVKLIAESSITLRC